MSFQTLAVSALVVLIMIGVAGCGASSSSPQPSSDRNAIQEFAADPANADVGEVAQDD